MENDIINLLLNHGIFYESTSKPILYHTVKMAHSIHVGQKFEDYCYVYLVTKLDGITDYVTKIQRQKSSTKFYNLINQNTEISNKIKY